MFPDINETTLIASDYLNHFRKLVTLLEAASSQPQGSADDLLSWRPVSYEEHFANSDFRDKALAIAAYRKAPTSGRALFDEAAARFHARHWPSSPRLPPSSTTQIRIRVS
jgi:hypothetical protein